MGKTPPPRRTLTKGKRKAAPARSKAKPQTKAKPRASAKPAASARPHAKAKRRPAAAAENDQLQAVTEELEAARGELSRLGHALSASHRELEERKLSSGSAEENLRAQMLALREELRATLAELEISRNEVERLRGKLAQYEAASASRKPAGSSPSV
jgi:chromosome segregation ATPase